ncbi:LPXTG cell wall anchor domain-containing protein [Streptococcus suis]|uniref:Probable hemoglobin and hemoglobin-haptoglobin-binding protein 3 n=1 Tax=Streptococcus suis TaxID=1307 RepID=A0A0Z8U9Q9_STRSU|nr:PT domain-containing protein [Streptococcus suis]MDG4500828.1 PT domain-containing protein [Streptococcus suis]NQR95510.1 LPXTG cell wall anchor domain-containing protein [Streptococcus suis]CYX33650.1 Probable hemoglobin and hemoglobin-haptoglobin-binding protein 3 precursor [Streptococcus suis]
MQVKKFAKWGLALTSTLVLGGAIAPVGNQLLGGSAVVYAQDGAVFEPYVVEFYIDGEYWGVANRGYNSGWPYVRLEPYSEEFPGKEWPSEELGGFTSNLPNVSVVTKEDLDSIGSVVKVYWTRKPVETLPVEQPTEKPVATPADQPVEKPISVLIGAISEVDGPLSHYYVTINPGETKTVETPKVDGYKLDQYTSPTYELTYDNALKQLNSAGFAWVQFWMIKDAAPETPVEQPTEQPTEQPAEQPVEQPTEKPAETPTDKPVDTPTEKPAETPTGKPVDTPTDKPVEQLTDASSLTDQTAGKAQAVTATDKKKVDKSAPSTPAVKPEEGSQTTTKTLPKTGDSSSMLLVLGGVLSGLSGLGLAATSRKRD